MRCPYCGAETFKNKPYLEPNDRSRRRYHQAEYDQYHGHVARCKRGKEAYRRYTGR